MSEVPAGLMRTAEGRLHGEPRHSRTRLMRRSASRAGDGRETSARTLPHQDGTTSVSVSLHRFADPQSAAPSRAHYLAQARAEALGLNPVPVADLGVPGRRDRRRGGGWAGSESVCPAGRGRGAGHRRDENPTSRSRSPGKPRAPCSGSRRSECGETGVTDGRVFRPQASPCWRGCGGASARCSMRV